MLQNRYIYMAAPQSNQYLQNTKQTQMSNKRAASYSINQKTLQTTDYNKSNDPIIKEEYNDDANRIIVKIKKQEVKDNPNCDNTTITAEDKTIPVIQTELKAQKIEPPSENKPETEKTVPPQSKYRIPDPKKGASLFAELFKTKQGCSIFARMGLFAGINKLPKDQKIPNYLDKDGKFVLPPRTKQMQDRFDSIFKFNRGGVIPPVKNTGAQGGNVMPKIPETKVKNKKEDEDEGDSAELLKDQNTTIDKSKSKGNYKYEQQVTVVISSPARKYKKNNGDLIESVEVILQIEQKSKIYILIVRLSATKHNIFSGIIIPGKSQLRVIHGKDQNLGISAFVIKQGKIIQKDQLRIQFQTAEQGKLFYSKLYIAVNPDSSQKVKQQHIQQNEGQWKINQ